MSTTEAKRTDNGEIEDLDVIVVGAGFAGLYLLDRLRSMGMAVQVFEAGGGLGGVWYWNCYPEARVDSPGPIYQYSRDDPHSGGQNCTPNDTLPRCQGPHEPHLERTKSR